MPLVIKKGMEFKPTTNIEKLFFSTVKLNIKKFFIIKMKKLKSIHHLKI